MAQFVAFSAKFAAGATAPAADPIYYAIVGQTGTEWEVGRGYLTSGTNLVRDEVYDSSNGGALVSLAAGTKDVFCTIAGKRQSRLTSIGSKLSFGAP